MSPLSKRSRSAAAVMLVLGLAPLSCTSWAGRNPGGCPDGGCAGEEEEEGEDGGTCPVGQRRLGGRCFYVDECDENNGGCSAFAYCLEGQGQAPTCLCRPGTTGDGRTCEDVVDCGREGMGCHPDADCVEVAPYRTCACRPGFAGDGYFCRDVDECLENHGGCAAEAACINTPGAHTCACGEWYAGSGFSCAPASACLEENGGCAAEASCSGTGEDVACTCPPGFRGDGSSCEDVDECATANGGCPATSRCVNTAGSFTCACPPGSFGDTREKCHGAFARLSAAGQSACAIKVDGSLWCWGRNDTGQLGVAGTVIRPNRVPAGPAGGWRDVSVSHGFTLAVRDDGTLWGWGEGEPVYPPRKFPAQIGQGIDWSRVVTGSSHACALKTDGSAWCWGTKTTDDALGTGANPVNPRLPNPVVGEGRYESISGGSTTCGIREDRTLWCWGNQPVEQVAGERWLSVAGGWWVTAVREDGTLWRFARRTDVPRPLEEGDRAHAEAGWKAVFGTDSGDCAARDDGTLHCWKQASPGFQGGALAPVEPGRAGPWLSVDGGRHFTCALHQDGALWCWGADDDGQLGDDQLSSPPPRLHLPGTSWRAVSAGSKRVCGIRGEDRSLWCWTRIETSGLEPDPSLDGPVHLFPGTRWSEVKTDAVHPCGIQENGRLWCWSRNKVRVEGEEKEIDVAVEPAPKTTWRSFFPGNSPLSASWTCGVRTEGSLWCWEIPQEVPEPVPAGLPQRRFGLDTDWVSVGILPLSHAGDYLWARKNTGQVFYAEFGQTERMREIPFSMDWSVILEYGFILRTDGLLWIKRFDGTTETLRDHRWSEVSGSADQFFGIREDGSLWRFDQGAYLRISQENDWASLSTHQEKGCALRSGGALWCWGYPSRRVVQVVTY